MGVRDLGWFKVHIDEKVPFLSYFSSIHLGMLCSLKFPDKIPRVSGSQNEHEVLEDGVLKFTGLSRKVDRHQETLTVEVDSCSTVVLNGNKIITRNPL